MAQETSNPGGTDPAGSTTKAAASETTSGNSETTNFVRIAAVYGTLLLVGVLAIYLIFGAGGLLDDHSGPLWEGVESLASVMLFPVIGAYLFLAHRDRLDALRASWQQHRSVVGAVSFVLLFILGFVLALTVGGTNYGSSAGSAERIAQEAIRELTNNATGPTNANLSDKVEKAKSDIAMAIDAAVGAAAAYGSETGGETDAIAARNAAARAAANRAKIVARVAIDDALPAIQTVTSDIDRIVKTAVDEARLAGREAALTTHGNDTTDGGFLSGLAGLRAPRVAEIVAGLSLALLIFGPSSLIRVTAPPGRGVEDPVMSCYFALLLGILVYVVFLGQ